MRPQRGPSRLRRGGPARRGGPGIPGAGPLRRQGLRGQISRQPHYGESGPGGFEKGGYRLRPAHFSGDPGGPGGYSVPAGGRRLSGGAVPYRGPAAGKRHIAHGHGGGAAGGAAAVCPGGKRRRGHAGPGSRGLSRLRRRPAPPPPPGGGGHCPGGPLADGAGGGGGAGLCRRDGPGEREAGHGDRRRRRPQHPYNVLHYHGSGKSVFIRLFKISFVIYPSIFRVLFTQYTEVNFIF